MKAEQRADRNKDDAGVANGAYIRRTAKQRPKHVAKCVTTSRVWKRRYGADSWRNKDWRA
ncbi:hypothetical protein ACU8KH_03034 [Lachancea thermotolerans]